MAERSSVTRGKICSRLRRLWRFSSSSSRDAKNQRTDNPKRIGAIDVSRAYFYAKRTRALYIQIPDEDWEPGDEGRVGELQLCLHGTRDAAQNWAETYTKYLTCLCRPTSCSRSFLCSFLPRRDRPSYTPIFSKKSISSIRALITLSLSRTFTWLTPSVKTTFLTTLISREVLRESKKKS